MNRGQLEETASACLHLIEVRFPQGEERGAAAMLLAGGSILTGTAPDAVNPAVEVCREIEPYAGAFRLKQKIIASVCLHRDEAGGGVVLSPCRVCRERLAVPVLAPAHRQLGGATAQHSHSEDREWPEQSRVGRST